MLIACYKGHYEVVKLLLEIGGIYILNEKNRYNISPLFAAYMDDHIETVKILLIQKNIIIKPVDSYHYAHNISEIRQKLKLLIKLYVDDKDRTVTMIKLEQNIDIFRHIIFLCDGYFTIKKL